MRPSAIIRVAAAGLGLAPLDTTLAQAPDACAKARPETAVVYRERPEGGPARDTGRVLRPSGNARYGVDVDSRIDIAVDVTCLRQALASRAAASPDDARHITAVSERVKRLSAAAAAIDSVMRLLSEAQAAHATAAQSGDFRDADRRIAAFSRAMRGLLASLRGAIRERLIQERGGSADVTAEVGATMSPIYRGPGYNFQAIRDALAREIAAAEAELRLVPNPSLAIEIRAHLIKARGEAVPIALPRYNTAETGPDTRFGRLQFEVTKEQRTLYDHYGSMVASLQSAQGLGRAVVSALEVEWQHARPEVDQLVRALRVTVEESRAELDGLQEWAQPGKRSAWLDSVRVHIDRRPEGKRVAAHWQSVGSALQSLKDDTDALKQLAKVPAALASRSSDEAMNSILAALSAMPTWLPAGGRLLRPADWRARADTLKAFVQAVQQLAANADARARLLAADGPVPDVRAVAAVAERVLQALEGTTSETRVWLSRAIAGDVARAAASLPVPPDQRRVSLSDDASTSMNLRTIPVPRDEGDIVRVSYEFYVGDRRLQDGWHDELRLRAFGLLGRAVAGLAFARPQSNNQWSPTASLSWIATYRRWPKQGSSGLGTTMRAIGLGLSTMSLNFESDERVQIGLAGTLSLIDDRILAGWGHNLQAKSRPDFWFFSLRLFSTSGSLGGS